MVFLITDRAKQGELSDINRCFPASHILYEQDDVITPHTSTFDVLRFPTIDRDSLSFLIRTTCARRREDRAFDVHGLLCFPILQQDDLGASFQWYLISNDWKTNLEIVREATALVYVRDLRSHFRLVF